MNSQRHIAWVVAAALSIVIAADSACSSRSDSQNSLKQNTGDAGSTTPTQSAYYPNSSGNIVAPPGNPAGNSSGSPPIVGGTANQQPAWPEGR